MNTSMTDADPASLSVPSASPADAWRIAVIDARALTGEILKMAAAPEFRAEAYANVPAWRDDTLMMATDDVRADLLVMGAYSHGRMREGISGGATRDVMRERPDSGPLVELTSVARVDFNDIW